MSLKLITPPAAEPVTLAEAKLHCRVDIGDDDALINALITAARQKCEHETGRALMSQTWEKTLDAFPDAIELPNPPVSSIVSVNYMDVHGVEQTLASASCTLDNASDNSLHYLVPAYGHAWPDTLPDINVVKVRYAAGYADASHVPATLKAWMLMAIGTLYRQREVIITGGIVAEVPRDFFSGLLDPYRIWRV